MLFDALTCALLVLYPPKDLPNWLSFVNLVLVGVIFVSTALFSSPNHHHLREKGFDETVITNLVNGNWIRTIAWSVRLLLLSGFLLQNSKSELNF
jgi:multisubunit Na+/H+ antiporter MnhB subunit